MQEYPQLIDYSDLALMVLDEKMLIFDINEVFISFYGFKKADMIGKSWNEFLQFSIPNSGIRATERPVNELLTRKFWCTFKDKKEITRILSATLTFDKTSNLYYAAFYDISEHLRSSNLLYDGDIFLNTLLENINLSIGFHDKTGTIIYVNRLLCEMTGLSREEIVGHDIKEFIDSDRYNKWMHTIDSSYESSSISVELELSPHKNNKILNILASLHVLSDEKGSIIGAIFVFTDITELKQEERRLYISDEKFKKAFHASPAPSSISILDEGRYIEVNDSFASLVGYKASDLVGHTVFEVNLFLKPEDRQEMVEMLIEQKKLRDYQLQIFSRTKGLRDFSVSAEIIELQGVECMIWVGYDITDKIKLEKEILSITERERYRMGQYLHDDLGQHLVGIEAMMSLLETRLTECENAPLELAKEISEYIQEAITKARHTARGLCPVRLEQNGLSSALEELAIKTEKMFGISCECKSSTKVTIFNSNIALNLYYIAHEGVNNAVKHSDAQHISINYASNDSNIYLAVKDDGKGFKIDKTESIGMGLELMRYRARAIGANLHIKSEPGHGTTLLLKFPRIHNKKVEWDWKTNSIYDKLYQDTDK